jgi:hypothetical protein
MGLRVQSGLTYVRLPFQMLDTKNTDLHPRGVFKDPVCCCCVSLLCCLHCCWLLVCDIFELFLEERCTRYQHLLSFVSLPGCCCYVPCCYCCCCSVLLLVLVAAKVLC